MINVNKNGIYFSGSNRDFSKFLKSIYIKITVSELINSRKICFLDKTR